MTVANTPSFLIEEANQRGMDMFEVLINSWGVINVVTASQRYSNIMYPEPSSPGIPNALAAIAIGPFSTVDRAWVSYSAMKGLAVPATVNYEQITDRARRISVGSPLLFHNSGKPSLQFQPNDTIPPDPKAAMAKGILAVFAASQVIAANPLPYSFTQQTAAGIQQDTTVLPSTYFDVNGNAQPFGSNLTVPNIPGTTASIFVPPQLHLYLYLKAPVLPLPASRAPYEMTSGVFSLGGGEEGDEVPIGQIPIFGRKRVRIAIRTFTTSSGDQPVVIRAATIRGMNQDPNNVWEVNAETITIAAVGTDEIELELPEADYLLLYGQSPSGNAVGCNYAVSAYD